MLFGKLLKKEHKHCIDSDGVRREPIEYYNLLSGGVFGKLSIVKSGYLSIYILGKDFIWSRSKYTDNLVFIPEEYKILVYYAEHTNVLNTKQPTWIYKGKWIGDFYKLVNDMSIKQQTKKKNVLQQKLRILEEY